jgi:hypothetical protein
MGNGWNLSFLIPAVSIQNPPKETLDYPKVRQMMMDDGI